MWSSGKSYNVAKYETEQQTTDQSVPLTDPSSQLHATLTGKPSKASNGGKWDEEEEDPTLTSCGMGSWRPQWLQKYSSPIWFMLNLAIVGVIQGMTGPLFFSSISTLEKRFSFDSKISGVILIADNFADMILNPIIGYLGVRWNRARLIGIGEIVLALGCFLTASPYWIYGPATHLLNDVSLNAVNGTANFEMCPASHSADECATTKGVTVWPAVIIFIIGSWFRGMGYTCYFVVGLPYLDDNIKKEQSPWYISIMQAIRLVGPACGFMLSSYCLSFYENPFVTPPFTRTDPRWLGAWWLSFAITGLLLFIVAVPMLFFPFQFKGASVKAGEIQNRIKEGGGSKGALKRFISNPLVLLFVGGNIFRYIGIGGYVMIKSKYIETQFRRSSSSASFITGSASFLPMAIGIMLGGWAISHFRPKPRSVFILVFLVEAVSFFTVGSGIFLGCTGSSSLATAADGTFTMAAQCNANCDCSTRVFSPVCSSGNTYFSPCYAGCRSYNQLTSQFEDCSCTGQAGVASKGYCPSEMADCDGSNNLVKYISVVTAGNFISSIARTPNSLIYLRTVDPIDKGFAIGMASSLLDMFAFVPYPLIFGYIADSACLIWETTCNKTGACHVYDNEAFRYRFHAAAIGFFALGSLFDFGMIFFAHRVKNFYDDEEEKEVVVKVEKTVQYSVQREEAALEVVPLNGDQALKI